MVPQVLYRVCYGTPFPTSSQVSHLVFQPAVLPGYVRRKVRSCDYPGITPAAAPTFVRGTYVNGLTDGDMWRLGIFEGSEYERKKVKVRLLTQDGVGQETPAKEDILDSLEKCVEGQQEVETDTYVFIAGDAMLEEGEWNFAEFKRDKMRRWAGVDEQEEYDGESAPSGGSLRSFHSRWREEDDLTDDR